ncbi:hypothetical protein [Candidatus Microthrix parvicella]|jgi:hypothetical protein|uniref:hypothetical protein n=1 Tax=Candidatus Neomicrothrix parvicella TaxID=41950 RepID=UPI00036BF319|nr:hypothetical protein [Candidatus Microthrix parvicella]
MTVTEEARYHRLQQLDDSVGEKGANTMMELLPPVGWADVATKRDLDQQSERLGLMVRAEISGVHAEIAGVRAEIAGVRGDFQNSLRRMQTVLLSAVVSVAGVVIAMAIYRPN